MFDPINLCDVAIVLSTYLVVLMLFAEVDLFVWRFQKAILKQTLEWQHGFIRTAFGICLLVASILMRMRM